MTTAGAGLALASGASGQDRPRLDRSAVVRRHNPHVTAVDPFAALTVGNGEFAFNVDVTGLQSLTAAYQRTWPLCTLAHWAWHSSPLPAGLSVEQFRYEDHLTQGRRVPYPTSSRGQEPLYGWLRANPHRLDLGRLGFAGLTPEALSGIDQSLDLLTGVVTSRFQLRGQPVAVATCCHAEQDAVAVRIESPLLVDGGLPLELAFPYGSSAFAAADWAHPAAHTTVVVRQEANALVLRRTVDATAYQATLNWTGAARLEQTGPHTFRLHGTERALEVVFHCARADAPDAHPTYREARASSVAGWLRFWTSGAALDFGDCRDPRAAELERRVVLSQYNTAVHCSGSLPSQETGLLYNSWNGKFHLEMHWWHSVHFVPWRRFARFARTLPCYARFLPQARAWARQQGYTGARWPKMVGPDGRDSPSPVGPLLCWQQPHPLYYAELCWRESPTRATLDAWAEIVAETAEFMASYAQRDATGGYHLGPPLKPASENQPAETCADPTFELSYWRFGLRVAQTWRERLGLPREPRWDAVLAGLAPLPQADGVYLMQAGLTDTYTRFNFEHPSLVGALGLLPGDGVDPAVMRATVKQVRARWRWDHTWGWDFPLLAMACARVGEPGLAVDALLLDSPKNRWLPNGHNYQRPELPSYLPGNGGLLAAVALMAGGWTGGPARPTPGFPVDQGWAVRAEGFGEWL